MMFNPIPQTHQMRAYERIMKAIKRASPKAPGMKVRGMTPRPAPTTQANIGRALRGAGLRS